VTSHQEGRVADFILDHIHLFSPDPEATAAFYARMFGAEILRSAPQGMKRIDLRLGDTMIFLLNVAGDDEVGAGPLSRHRGLDHFGLCVPDLDAAVAELKAKGAVFVVEPMQLRPDLRVAFMRGPEDVRIELLERREP
jgi:lactoylglutathione lyase